MTERVAELVKRDFTLAADADVELRELAQRVIGIAVTWTPPSTVVTFGAAP